VVVRDDRSSFSRRRRRGRVTSTLVGLSLLVGLTVTGCSTHDDVAASHPCTFTVAGKVVAGENRGKIGLAKVGLTPKGLKAQEKCK
jgi:hypothetical protein